MQDTEDYGYYDYQDTYDCGCCTCCGCTCEDWFDEDVSELTEEELQHYDDVCEEYEENKRERLQLEQEY